MDKDDRDFFFKLKKLNIALVLHLEHLAIVDACIDCQSNKEIEDEFHYETIPNTVDFVMKALKEEFNDC